MRPDEVIQTERRAAETMSETSEGTPTSSISGKSGFESREEIRDLAAVLGIANPEDVHQDRFRVDRRKLEQMLQEIKKRSNPFNGSAAPGAERKVTASTAASTSLDTKW
ncbi:hypothetical protein M0802_002131 [Mischocyttarus mexicanus]|nr:hypothetical protein M0802_002131 [Mischocyttarus mexicanus]